MSQRSRSKYLIFAVLGETLDINLEAKKNILIDFHYKVTMSKSFDIVAFVSPKHSISASLPPQKGRLSSKEVFKKNIFEQVKRVIYLVISADS